MIYFFYFFFQVLSSVVRPYIGALDLDLHASVCTKGSSGTHVSPALAPMGPMNMASEPIIGFRFGVGLLILVPAPISENISNISGRFLVDCVWDDLIRCLGKYHLRKCLAFSLHPGLPQSDYPTKPYGTRSVII